MKKVSGPCAICGTVGQLSYEHIPPRAAFNKNTKFWTATFVDVLELDLDQNPKVPPQQGGIGKFSLCRSCNTAMGTLYGRAYVDWCKLGAYILYKAGPGRVPATLLLQQMYPLKILKQIISMFVSVNHDSSYPLREHFPELTRFLLNKDSKEMPDVFKVYAYYVGDGRVRYQPVTGIGNFHKPNYMSMMSEIAFHPYGFVFTIESDCPDERLTDITFFSRYGYDEKTDLYMPATTLPVFSLIPADYRPEKQVRQEMRGKL